MPTIQFAGDATLVVNTRGQSVILNSLRANEEEIFIRLMGILERLIARVLEAAPSAVVTQPPNLVVRLGDGVLVVDPMRSAPPNRLAAIGRPPAFDVIAYTASDAFQWTSLYGLLWALTACILNLPEPDSLWYNSKTNQQVMRLTSSPF
ncbi:MAG TPA: hypothetical protein DEP84_25180 [Chloroflexi bacterium]|nr:hypothetical protein [Chloroflexota bacterium]